MLNIAIIPLKMRNFLRNSLFVTALAVLFFSYATTRANAQYYQSYPYQTYSYQSQTYPYQNQTYPYQNQSYPYGYGYGYGYPNPYDNSQFYVTVTTTSATNITSGSAILHGQVNGSTVYSTSNLDAWFEYGTNTSFGYSTAHIPSNSGYASLSTTVANLSPNTVYYFRAVAQRPQGVVYGNTVSFATIYPSVSDINYNTNYPIYSIPVAPSNPANPTAITQPATAVSSQSVELNSLILNSQNDYNTNTWFEYGTGPNLGNSTTTVSVGTLPSAKHVNVLSGLLPGTTYYYRAVVQNSSWKNNGPILSFATSGVKPSPVIYTTAPTNTQVITSNPYPYPYTYVAPTPAPATYTTGTQSSLSANASGSGYFFPMNTFGTLTFIVLVLVIILLGMHLFYKISDNRPVQQ